MRVFGKPMAICAAMCVQLSASPVAAKAAEPLDLARQGAWEVNYDVDACHLIGSFGQGRDRIVARFSRFSPGDSFYLDLFGQPVRTSGLQVSASVDFGPTANPREIRALAGNSGDLPLLKLGQLNLLDTAPEHSVPRPAISPEQEAAVTYLDLGLRSVRYRLALGAMQKTMQSLRACSTDLVQFWGYDPAQQATLSRWPTPKTLPGSWLRSRDYPTDPLANGQSSVIQFRLGVDESGRVVGCHIQQQTKGEDFAKRTCELLTRRATFDPALDAAGKPIRSFYVSRVFWLAPS